MADPRGFLRYERTGPRRRPVETRVRDWGEVYLAFGREELTEQAARCMSCGIAFCHEGCPLGNLIPEWNDLVERGRFAEASDRLHATNNFPELTGRLCPAPCEGSCVLGIIAEPVLIKQVELETAEWAASSGVLAPHRAGTRTGKKVAIVGSGPAGLAAAQQLTRAGHAVVVFERAERIGGLLRYGIPAFKLEKSVLDRRLAQMEEEGTEFRARVEIGRPDPLRAEEVPGAAATDVSVLSAKALRGEFDAVVLAGGATRPRDLTVPGRHLRGVHFAMEYLKSANLVCEGTLEVVIGGQDLVSKLLGSSDDSQGIGTGAQEDGEQVEGDFLAGDALSLEEAAEHAQAVSRHAQGMEEAPDRPGLGLGREKDRPILPQGPGEPPGPDLLANELIHEF